MTWAIVWATLKGAGSAAWRAPEWLKGGVAFLLLAGAAWWLHSRSVELAIVADRAEQAQIATIERDRLLGAERARSLAAVAMESAKTRIAWAARDSAVGRTRRLEQQLATSQRQLADALVKLPDSVRALPPVDTLVRACTALAHDCEQLRASVAVEREAADTARAFARRETAARLRLQAESDSAIAKSSVVIAEQHRQLEQKRGSISKGAAAIIYGALRVTEAVVKHQWRSKP